MTTMTLQSGSAGAVLIERLEQHVKSIGLTHQELADRIGCQRPNVTRVFRSKPKVGIDFFIELCHAADTTLYEMSRDLPKTGELRTAKTHAQSAN